jgi:hypothetical protein
MPRVPAFDAFSCRQMSPILTQWCEWWCALTESSGSQGDSPQEQTGFEPVWAFPVKWQFLVLCRFFVRSWKAVFIPSPATRFAERAEGVKGPKR